ncbi:hypothetical protein [Silvanigrella sp.]|jgi:hypothetical protein|uniref:hypothetical protein n=1 Tax=Silvanigrella sp. TaxID=2024976 RepID=UPI0037C9748A
MKRNWNQWLTDYKSGFCKNKNAIYDSDEFIELDKDEAIFLNILGLRVATVEDLNEFCTDLRWKNNNITTHPMSDDSRFQEIVNRVSLFEEKVPSYIANELKYKIINRCETNESIDFAEKYLEKLLNAIKTYKQSKGTKQ